MMFNTPLTSCANDRMSHDKATIAIGAESTPHMPLQGAAVGGLDGSGERQADGGGRSLIGRGRLRPFVNAKTEP